MLKEISTSYGTQPVTALHALLLHRGFFNKQVFAVKQTNNAKFLEGC